MKRLPKIVSLKYLENMVREQEEKEKPKIGYVYDDVYDTELKLLQRGTPRTRGKQPFEKTI